MDDEARVIKAYRTRMAIKRRREPEAERCPWCGSSVVTVLFRTVECPTEGCKNYNPALARWVNP